jgi:colicin import membrane protein
MKKEIGTFIVCGAFLCAVVSGCEGEEITEKTTAELVATEVITTETVTETVTEKTATPDEPEQLKNIGEATEDGYEVTLKNATGQDIVELMIYDTVSDEYGDNLIEDDFLADEERVLYCENVSDDGEINEDNENDKLLTVGYDIRIVLEDESEYVLHSFPFEEITEGEIFVEDEVAYVEYDDYSTKEAELAIKEAESIADAPAATTAAPVKNTAPVATTAAPVTTTAPVATTAAPVTTTEAPIATTEAPVVTEAPAVEQGSENCIGDEGLTY